MGKPFDATGKDMVDLGPADWLEYLGYPRVAVEVIDADVSTVTAAADKVLRVGGPVPHLVALDPQSGYDADGGDRLLLYGVLLTARHALPVRSVMILLRPRADGPEMTGRVRRLRPDGTCYLDFAYDVVRVWQRPVEEVLSAGLAVLPLAPLSDITPEQLPGVVRRIKERVDREAPPPIAAKIMTATGVMMGMRYSIQLVEKVMFTLSDVEDSTFIVAVRRRKARETVLRLATKKFGPPSVDARSALEAADLERLRRLADRLLDVGGWAELLAD